VRRHCVLGCISAVCAVIVMWVVQPYFAI
jgi:hypothetical protein